MSATNILEAVRQAAAVKILFLPHALRQMSRPERMILSAEVRHAVETGELIEDYPDDVRGPSCLLLAGATHLKHAVKGRGSIPLTNIPLTSFRRLKRKAEECLSGE